MKQAIWTGMALAVLSLVGCGGGGGGGATAPTPTPTPVAKAEGVYSGTLLSNGVSGVFSTVILEDDSIWAIYGVPGTGGSTIVQGFVNGVGASNNGSYSASGKDYGNTGGVLSSTINATYTPGVSISGTGSGGSTFNGTTAAVSGYNYNTPFQIANLVGTWSGSSLSGQAMTMSIASNGNYTVNTGGCPGTGTITARASGKNIANITYSHNNALCFPTTLSGSGIGVVSTLTNGRLQLVGVVTTTDKSAGTAIFVTK